MQSAATGIDGLVVVTVKQATDERGTVRELFRASAYAELLAGLGTWEQVNVTETQRGGVRGLHGEAMTKLVACVAGEAFGAYLDARPGSPTFGASASRRTACDRRCPASLLSAGVRRRSGRSRRRATNPLTPATRNSRRVSRGNHGRSTRLRTTRLQAWRGTPVSIG